MPQGKASHNNSKVSPRLPGLEYSPAECAEQSARPPLKGGMGRAGLPIAQFCSTPYIPHRPRAFRRAAPLAAAKSLFCGPKIAPTKQERQSHAKGSKRGPQSLPKASKSEEKTLSGSGLDSRPSSDPAKVSFCWQGPRFRHIHEWQKAPLLDSFLEPELTTMY